MIAHGRRDNSRLGLSRRKESNPVRRPTELERSGTLLVLELKGHWGRTTGHQSINSLNRRLQHKGTYAVVRRPDALSPIVGAGVHWVGTAIAPVRRVWCFAPNGTSAIR